MIPVTQTRLHVPGSGLPGNCFPAAIASILEVALDDVPQPGIGEGSDGGDWVQYWPRLAEYLASIGYCLMHIPLSESGTGPWVTDGILDEPVLIYIANGPGGRGADHSVVMRGMKLAHDPHPSRDGLESVTSHDYLIPLDPAGRVP